MIEKRDFRSTLVTVILILLMLVVIYLIAYLGYLTAREYQQAVVEVYHGALEKFNSYWEKIMRTLAE